MTWRDVEGRGGVCVEIQNWFVTSEKTRGGTCGGGGLVNSDVVHTLLGVKRSGPKVGPKKRLVQHVGAAHAIAEVNSKHNTALVLEGLDGSLAILCQSGNVF